VGSGAQKTCNISETVQDRTKVTMTDWHQNQLPMTLDDLERPKPHSCRNKKNYGAQQKNLNESILIAVKLFVQMEPSSLLMSPHCTRDVVNSPPSVNNSVRNSVVSSDDLLLLNHQPMSVESSRRVRGPPCRVCGDESSGVHYGVDSCEGCKVTIGPSAWAF